MRSITMMIPEEMRKKYLERRVRDAETLTAAVDEGNFHPFLTIGHQIKGNAVTFGYDSLVDLGRRMERAGEKADSTQARECLFAFKAWIQEQSSVGESG